MVHSGEKGVIIKRQILMPLMIVSACLIASSCDHGPPCIDDTVLDTEPLDSLSLIETIEEIKAEMPGRDSNGYHGPNQGERVEFASAISMVMTGDVSSADSALEAFGYDAGLVLETTSRDTLVIIQERSPVERGWGTYVYNLTTDEAFDVHINHPIYDINTYQVGTDLYVSSHARWLLIAGTHRYANPGANSDMARSWTSIFQAVHELIAPSGAIAVSIHGFTPDYYGPPIDTTDIILSNGCTTGGDWEATASAVTLRGLLREAGWFAALVAYDDESYLELSGAVNPQGRHSNTAFGHGRWIHVELARPIREHPPSWTHANEVISGWARASIRAVSREIANNRAALPGA
jgi:hypothetical protein